MSSPTVAVLGTGVMGAGMVRSLRRAGLPVRLWNRDAGKADALTDTGALAFGSPSEAARGADVVLTMVFDADATIAVIRQAAPPPGTVWLQTTTVGVEGADRTVDVAGELGLVLVDAPVLGTRKPAEDGALVVLASGPEGVRAGLLPVLDAIGSRTLWLGDAGAGSRMKVVCNAWVLTVTAGIAQSVALAEGLGVDPRQFLAAIQGGATDTPYAHVKGPQMIDGDFPLAFSLAGAIKDAGLIATALRDTGVSDALAAAVLQTVQVAGSRVPDPAAVDMGALVTGFRPG